ncbi:hypothetical protein AAHA92_02117 [Salvia divinorum]|uniref:Uncharacterized protein n=1 Tax=Salvia divinorum TaxID=28513 RepID=A0ABD1ICS4_SALDI
MATDLHSPLPPIYSATPHRGLPPAMAQPLQVLLPGIRSRVLHRHAPVGAPIPPPRSQTRPRRTHQPRLYRFRQPQYQAG